MGMGMGMDMDMDIDVSRPSEESARLSGVLRWDRGGGGGGRDSDGVDTVALPVAAASSCASSAASRPPLPSRGVPSGGRLTEGKGAELMAAGCAGVIVGEGSGSWTERTT